MKQRRSILARFFPVFLATAYLSTQCLFAHKPETTLWEQRRQYARLSSINSKFQVPNPNQNLISNFQNGKDGLAGSDLNFAWNLGFDSWDLSPFGSIRKVLTPPAAKKDRVVLHIQDVHLNNEAQSNVGSALQSLINKNRVGLVALEGAFASIDLTPFQSFPHTPSLQKASDFFLKENKISGPVHAALSTGKAVPLVGVDDAPHYDANVNAYKQAEGAREKIKKQIAQAERALETKKKNVFNPVLADFDGAVERYGKNQIGLGEFAVLLSGRLSDVPDNMRLFLEALQTEREMDFARVESERTRLLDRLLSSLNKIETTDLTNAAVAYRLGKIRHTDFYSYLKNRCEKNGVRLHDFPAMNSYLQYVLLTDRIDVEKLLEEISASERAVYEALAVKAEEKDLVRQSVRIRLTAKLIDFSLTKPEWEAYKELPPLEEGRVGRGIDGNSFEEFYRQAEIRDQKMADNFLRETQPGKLSVLVTGGFHSTGIQKRLVDAGYTVVQFTPKITKVDTENGAAYLSVFTREKTPLEKMFEGEKLFLAGHPVAPSEIPELAGSAAAQALALKGVTVEKMSEWLASAVSRYKFKLVGRPEFTISENEITVAYTVAFKKGQRRLSHVVGFTPQSTLSSIRTDIRRTARTALEELYGQLVEALRKGRRAFLTRAGAIAAAATGLIPRRAKGVVIGHPERMPEAYRAKFERVRDLILSHMPEADRRILTRQEIQAEVVPAPNVMETAREITGRGPRVLPSNPPSSVTISTGREGAKALVIIREDAFNYKNDAWLITQLSHELQVVLIFIKKEFRGGFHNDVEIAVAERSNTVLRSIRNARADLRNDLDQSIAGNIRSMERWKKRPRERFVPKDIDDRQPERQPQPDQQPQQEESYLRYYLAGGLAVLAAAIFISGWWFGRKKTADVKSPAPANDSTASKSKKKGKGRRGLSPDIAGLLVLALIGIGITAFVCWNFSPVGLESGAILVRVKKIFWPMLSLLAAFPLILGITDYIGFWKGMEEGTFDFYESARINIRPVWKDILTTELISRIKTGDTVLEVGAGYYGLLKLVGDKVPPGVRWIAGDLVPRPLPEPMPYPFEQTILQLPDQIPSDIPPVDVVIGLSVLDTISDETLEATLKALFERTKPGGLLLHGLELEANNEVIMGPRSAKGWKAITTLTQGMARFDEYLLSSYSGAIFYDPQKLLERMNSIRNTEPMLSLMFLALYQNQEQTLEMLRKRPTPEPFLKLIEDMERHGLIEERIPSINDYFQDKLRAAAVKAGFEIEFSGPVTRRGDVPRANLKAAIREDKNIYIYWNGAEWSDRDPRRPLDPEKVLVQATGQILVARKPGKAPAPNAITYFRDRLNGKSHLEAKARAEKTIWAEIGAIAGVPVVVVAALTGLAAWNILSIPAAAMIMFAASLIFVLLLLGFTVYHGVLHRRLLAAPFITAFTHHLKGFSRYFIFYGALAGFSVLFHLNPDFFGFASVFIVVLAVLGFTSAKAVWSHWSFDKKEFQPTIEPIQMGVLGRLTASLLGIAMIPTFVHADSLFSTVVRATGPPWLSNLFIVGSLILLSLTIFKAAELVYYWSQTQDQTFNYYEQSRQNVRPVLKKILADEMAGRLKPGQTVLEVGAGHHGLLKLIGDALPRGIRWIAGDVVTRPLPNPMPYPFEQAVVILPDQIPDSIQQVDAVTALSVLDTIPEDELESALRKLLERLKPGGLLVHFLELGTNSHVLVGPRKEKGWLHIPSFTQDLMTYKGHGILAITGVRFYDPQKLRQVINTHALSTEHPLLFELLRYLYADPEGAINTLLGMEDNRPFLALSRMMEEFGLIEEEIPSRNDYFREKLEMAATAAGFEIEFSGEKSQVMDVSREGLTEKINKENNVIVFWNGIQQPGFDRSRSIDPDSVHVQLTGQLLVARKPLKPTAPAPVAESISITDKDTEQPSREKKPASLTTPAAIVAAGLILVLVVGVAVAADTFPGFSLTAGGGTATKVLLSKNLLWGIIAIFLALPLMMKVTDFADFWKVKTKDTFDYYEEARAKTRRPLKQILETEIAGRLKPGQVVMEIGAGYYDLLKMMGDKIPAGVRWIAADLAPRPLPAPMPYPFEQAIVQLPGTIPSEIPPLDAVVGLTVFNTFSDDMLAPSLKALFDRMKPGGLFIHFLDLSINDEVVTDTRTKKGWLSIPYYTDDLISIENRGISWVTGYRFYSREKLHARIQSGKAGRDTPILRALYDYPKEFVASAMQQGPQAFARLNKVLENNGLVEETIRNGNVYFTGRFKKFAEAAGFVIEQAGDHTVQMEVPRSSLKGFPQANNTLVRWNGIELEIINKKRSIPEDKVLVQYTGQLLVARKPTNAPAPIVAPAPNAITYFLDRLNGKTHLEAKARAEKTIWAEIGTIVGVPVVVLGVLTGLVAGKVLTIPAAAMIMFAASLVFLVLLLAFAAYHAVLQRRLLLRDEIFVSYTTAFVRHLNGFSLYLILYGYLAGFSLLFATVPDFFSLPVVFAPIAAWFIFITVGAVWIHWSYDKKEFQRGFVIDVLEEIHAASHKAKGPFARFVAPDSDLKTEDERKVALQKAARLLKIIEDLKNKITSFSEELSRVNDDKKGEVFSEAMMDYGYLKETLAEALAYSSALTGLIEGIIRKMERGGFSDFAESAPEGNELEKIYDAFIAVEILIYRAVAGTRGYRARLNGVVRGVFSAGLFILIPAAALTAVGFPALSSGFILAKGSIPSLSFAVFSKLFLLIVSILTALGASDLLTEGAANRPKESIAAVAARMHAAYAEKIPSYLQAYFSPNLIADFLRAHIRAATETNPSLLTDQIAKFKKLVSGKLVAWHETDFNAAITNLTTDILAINPNVLSERETPVEPKVEEAIASVVKPARTVEGEKVIVVGDRRAVLRYNERNITFLEKANPGVREKIEKMVSTSFEKLKKGPGLDYQHRSGETTSSKYPGRGVVFNINKSDVPNRLSVKSVSLKGGTLEVGKSRISFDPIDLAVTTGLRKASETDLTANDYYFTPEGVFEQVPYPAIPLFGMRFDDASVEFETADVISAVGFESPLPLAVVEFPDEPTADGATAGVVVLGFPDEDITSASQAFGQVINQNTSVIMDFLRTKRRTLSYIAFETILRGLCQMQGRYLRRLNDAGVAHLQFNFSNWGMVNDRAFVKDTEGVELAWRLTPNQYFGYVVLGLRHSAGAMVRINNKIPQLGQLNLNWVGWILEGYTDVEDFPFVPLDDLTDAFNREQGTPMFLKTQGLVELVRGVYPELADLSREQLRSKEPASAFIGRYKGERTPSPNAITYLIDRLNGKSHVQAKARAEKTVWIEIGALAGIPLILIASVYSSMAAGMISHATAGFILLSAVLILFLALTVFMGVHVYLSRRLAKTGDQVSSTMASFFHHGKGFSMYFLFYLYLAIVSSALLAFSDAFSVFFFKFSLITLLAGALIAAWSHWDFDNRELNDEIYPLKYSLAGLFFAFFTSKEFLSVLSLFITVPVLLAGTAGVAGRGNGLSLGYFLLIVLPLFIVGMAKNKDWWRKPKQSNPAPVPLRKEDVLPAHGGVEYLKQLEAGRAQVGKPLEFFLRDEVLPYLDHLIRDPAALGETVELMAGRGYFFRKMRELSPAPFNSWLQTDASRPALNDGAGVLRTTQWVDVGKKFPFADGSKQAFLIYSGLHSVEPKMLPHVFKEMARSLKENGEVLAVLDLQPGFYYPWEGEVGTTLGLPYFVQKDGMELAIGAQYFDSAKLLPFLRRDPEKWKLIIEYGLDNQKVTAYLRAGGERTIQFAREVLALSNEPEALKARIRFVSSIAEYHFGLVKKAAEEAGLEVLEAGPVERTYIMDDILDPAQNPEGHNKLIYHAGFGMPKKDPTVAEGQTAFEITLYRFRAVKKPAVAQPIPAPNAITYYLDRLKGKSHIEARGRALKTVWIEIGVFAGIPAALSLIFLQLIRTETVSIALGGRILLTVNFILSFGLLIFTAYHFYLNRKLAKAGLPSFSSLRALWQHFKGFFPYFLFYAYMAGIQYFLIRSPDLIDTTGLYLIFLTVVILGAGAGLLHWDTDRNELNFLHPIDRFHEVRVQIQDALTQINRVQNEQLGAEFGDKWTLITMARFVLKKAEKALAILEAQRAFLAKRGQEGVIQEFGTLTFNYRQTFDDFISVIVALQRTARNARYLMDFFYKMDAEEFLGEDHRMAVENTEDDISIARDLIRYLLYPGLLQKTDAPEDDEGEGDGGSHVPASLLYLVLTLRPVYKLAHSLFGARTNKIVKALGLAWVPMEGYLIYRALDFAGASAPLLIGFGFIFVAAHFILALHNADPNVARGSPRRSFVHGLIFSSYVVFPSLLHPFFPGINAAYFSVAVVALHLIADLILIRKLNPQMPSADSPVPLTPVPAVSKQEPKGPKSKKRQQEKKAPTTPVPETVPQEPVDRRDFLRSAAAWLAGAAAIQGLAAAARVMTPVKVPRFVWLFTTHHPEDVKEFGQILDELSAENSEVIAVIEQASPSFKDLSEDFQNRLKRPGAFEDPGILAAFERAIEHHSQEPLRIIQGLRSGRHRYEEWADHPEITYLARHPKIRVVVERATARSMAALIQGDMAKDAAMYALYDEKNEAEFYEQMAAYYRFVQIRDDERDGALAGLVERTIAKNPAASIAVYRGKEHEPVSRRVRNYGRHAVDVRLRGTTLGTPMEAGFEAHKDRIMRGETVPTEARRSALSHFLWIVLASGMTANSTPEQSGRRAMQIVRRLSDQDLRDLTAFAQERMQAHKGLRGDKNEWFEQFGRAVFRWLIDNKKFTEEERRLVPRNYAALNLRKTRGVFSLVSNSTLKAYGAGLFTSLVRAPDDEFLLMLRPDLHLKDHDGPWWRHAFRIGIGLPVIYGAMLAPPFLVAIYIFDPFMANGVLKLLAIVAFSMYWYATIFITFGIALENPHRELSWKQKLALAPAYASQFLSHSFYNLFFSWARWAAPSVDRLAWEIDLVAQMRPYISILPPNFGPVVSAVFPPEGGRRTNAEVASLVGTSNANVSKRKDKGLYLLELLRRVIQPNGEGITPILTLEEAQAILGMIAARPNAHEQIPGLASFRFDAPADFDIVKFDDARRRVRLSRTESITSHVVVRFEPVAADNPISGYVIKSVGKDSRDNSYSWNAFRVTHGEPAHWYFTDADFLPAGLLEKIGRRVWLDRNEMDFLFSLMINSRVVGGKLGEIDNFHGTYVGVGERLVMRRRTLNQTSHVLSIGRSVTDVWVRVQYLPGGYVWHLTKPRNGGNRGHTQRYLRTRGDGVVAVQDGPPAGWALPTRFPLIGLLSILLILGNIFAGVSSAATPSQQTALVAKNKGPAIELARAHARIIKALEANKNASARDLSDIIGAQFKIIMELDRNGMSLSQMSAPVLEKEYLPAIQGQLNGVDLDAVAPLELARILAGAASAAPLPDQDMLLPMGKPTDGKIAAINVLRASLSPERIIYIASNAEDEKIYRDHFPGVKNIVFASARGLLSRDGNLNPQAMGRLIGAHAILNEAVGRKNVVAILTPDVANASDQDLTSWFGMIGLRRLLLKDVVPCEKVGWENIFRAVWILKTHA